MDIKMAEVKPIPPADKWVLARPKGKFAELAAVETNHPAVVDCMGSEPECAAGGCQGKRWKGEVSQRTQVPPPLDDPCGLVLEWVSKVKEVARAQGDTAFAAWLDSKPWLRAAAPPASPPCENGTCNPYPAKCGATFCTLEEMADHEKVCPVTPPASPPEPEP